MANSAGWFADSGARAYVIAMSFVVLAYVVLGSLLAYYVIVRLPHKRPPRRYPPVGTLGAA